jgi:hypothetical protein
MRRARRMREMSAHNHLILSESTAHNNMTGRIIQTIY